MTYCTPEMVRQALVPSSDGAVPEAPTHTAADLTNTQLLDAIAEADVLIDGYLSGRYTTPVAAVGTPTATTPHPVDYWSRNIAAYLATLTFRGSQDFSDQDPIYRRYVATMDALKAVAAGKMVLQIPANAGDTSVVGVGPAFNPYSGTLFPIEDFDVNPGWGSLGPSPFWRGR
jgi:phage gp36-like protein